MPQVSNLAHTFQTWLAFFQNNNRTGYSECSAHSIRLLNYRVPTNILVLEI